MFGEVFVNRKKLFAAVEAVLQRKGRGRHHVFLEGRRLVGKTSFLQEFVARRPQSEAVVLNLEHLVSTPRLFARNAMALFLRPFLGGASPEGGNLAALPAAMAGLPEGASQVVAEFVKRLRAEERDDEALLRALLDLPERLAQACDRDVVVAYDSFESLLNLRSYPSLRKVERVVEDVLSSHERVRYVITAQRSQCLRQLMQRKRSFWARAFARLAIGPLNRYDSYFLASLIFGAECRPIPRQVLPTVAHYSAGIPFYVEALAGASLAQAKAVKEEVAQRHVNRALVVEVLSPGGRIHQACQRILAESLSAVAGENSLRGILQILASEEGKSLSEVARAMGRPNGQVHGYLKALVEAELLWRCERRFYFRDPMLRFFVHQALDAHCQSSDPKPEEVDAMARCFFESFLLGRPESDLDTELRVRALSTEFEGQSLSGEYFGSEDEVTLPADPSEEQLIDFDNEGSVLEEPAIIASDLLLKGRRRWMVEVKSEAEPIGLEELAIILRKRRFFESRYRMCFDRVWVVADEGFTSEARSFAHDNRMLISGAADLAGLEGLLHAASLSERVGAETPARLS